VDKTTGKETTENRYYLKSMALDRLTPGQWLLLFRQRWGVENGCHNTFDTIFNEDKRPWLMLPQGMVVVMLRRRIAYNLLTLLRSVTLRDDGRTLPWKLPASAPACVGGCLRPTSGQRAKTAVPAGGDGVGGARTDRCWMQLDRPF